MPVGITGLTSGVTAIAARGAFSLAVRNGNVYAWGNDLSGELGDGSTTDSNTPIEIDPTILSNIVAVAAGSDSSYALSSDGSLWVWGGNYFGELGLGTNTSFYDTPQHLLAPSGYRFTGIDAGDGFHAVATLAAVPEPASLALLALGNGLLMANRRKRRVKRL